MNRQLIQEVSSLNGNPRNRELAGSYGLSINTISWEDTARTKNSCWGPNISDLTLITGDRLMCMIRKPNFADVTADVPYNVFQTTIGNQVQKGELKKIPLKEYITDINKYSGSNFKDSLWSERDDNLLLSAQCCILPCDEKGEVEFCPKIFNYQASVLAIICTNEGTSAQILNKPTKMYFNREGRQVELLAKRQTQYRLEKGIANNDEEMTNQEENLNQILIFQIPLKKKQPPRVPKLQLDDHICGNGQSRRQGGKYARQGNASLGMENAMLRASDIDRGQFEKLEGDNLIRDERYPIRVTYQFYKVTDSQVIEEKDMQYIQQKIDQAYSIAKNEGSLVLNETNRPTEHTGLEIKNFADLKMSENEQATPLFDQTRSVQDYLVI